MTAMTWIVVWGVTAILSSVIAGGLAGYKNRDYSFWMGSCFLLPPLLVVLILLPHIKGPRPKRPSLDEEDKHWY
ncbi:MAG: hypothetical protein KJ587_18635 [Alphaproteobacteria bacterium]|nr:hypothetical protein [Alphaproteobacteria bacterium]